MIQLQSTQTAGLSNGVKMLVYGRAGAGKTVLCSTAPAPVIISAEAGLLSLSGFNLPFIPVKTYAELSEVHRWVFESQEARQFATICVDSISEIAEVVLAAERVSAGKDPRRAYGELATKIIQVVRDFRDVSNKHVVMLAKQEHKKDETTGGMIYGPSFPGQQLSQQMPYFFDEVFHLYVGSDPATKATYRAIRTQPDFQFEAKDRSGRLAPIEPADLSHIIGKITGQVR